MQKNTLAYFFYCILLSMLGIAAAFFLGWQEGGLPLAIHFLFTTILLAGLEISVSLDNAIVNTAVLRQMSPFWKTIFLTVGIAIAVCGMRVLFPLVIVTIAGNVDLHSAWIIATSHPDRYRLLMEQSHLAIMGFGGAFLLMVVLTFFFNQNKKTHWLPKIEPFLIRLGNIENATVSLSILIILGITLFLPPEKQFSFLLSAISGCSVHILLDIVRHFAGSQNISQATGRSGLIGFLYLEVLDSSFSFDGVIAAFAITDKFYLIAIGLGIGALFVRSMTIYLLKKGSLKHFIFLEPAAFWAIGFLVFIMFSSASGFELPGGEITTALTSMGILSLGIITSIRAKTR